jgi:hypothetical protein
MPKRAEFSCCDHLYWKVETQYDNTWELVVTKGIFKSKPTYITKKEKKIQNGNVIILTHVRIKVRMN